MPSERIANSIRARRDEVTRSLQAVAGEGFQVEVLREQFAHVVQDLMRFEDEGWLKLWGDADKAVKGFTLEDVRKVTVYLEKQTKILGDLLGRGLRLKNNHAFGRGFNYEVITPDGKSEKLKPRHRAIMENPHNWETVFSPTAIKELNRIIYTSGNIILMYDEKEKSFERLAIDVDISDYISDSRFPTRIKYYLRTWTERNDLRSSSGEGNAAQVKYEWVPTSSYVATNPRTRPKTISYMSKAIPVNWDAVIIDRRYNRDNGETWGVPDAFSAAAPAHIYATYMKDGAMLQHALSAIAFVVKAKTETAGRTAGAKLQRDKAGQAAITGPETEIQSMPRAGSVNLYEGRPLVARVAAALDVSTTGLTSDPGPGGSYASENALSAPEQMAALSRQEDFANLFAEIFRVIKAEGARINFKRLDTDPVHRQLQSLGLARTMGFIHQAEGRERTLELLDIEPTSTALPKPDEFTGSKYSTLKAQVDAGLVNAADAAANSSDDPNASQGNSGAVGSLDDANSARDDDSAAGTA